MINPKYFMKMIQIFTNLTRVVRIKSVLYMFQYHKELYKIFILRSYYNLCGSQLKLNYFFQT